MNKVIKRDFTQVDFDETKIAYAIEMAMCNSIRGVYVEGQAEEIAEEIYQEFCDLDRDMNISEIEDLVDDKLHQRDNGRTAREYRDFKTIRAFQRKENTTDKKIESLINGDDKDQKEENSNKNPSLISTQRDLIAGEVSKDIARRKLLTPNVLMAHDEGVIHIHDMDYQIQPMFNCCLIDIEDILNNGTVINGKMVEKPKSFQVACTIVTQIIAQIASNQLGGQSVDISHLGQFAEISHAKHFKNAINDFGYDSFEDLTDEESSIVENIAYNNLMREIKAGVQTMQYQINTLMTTNG